jgi:hypothetical protein
MLLNHFKYLNFYGHTHNTCKKNRGARVILKRKKKEGKENFIFYEAMAFMAYLIVLRDGFSSLPPAGKRTAIY